MDITMLKLLNSFGRKGTSYGLYTEKVDVIDVEYLSRYFVVSEFNPTFTAGKNSIAVNGSPFLVNGSEILIECLDSKGNNLFIEMAKYSNVVIASAYKEATSYVFSIHVYNDTSDGVGKLILYGTLTDGRSVKWMQNITINKSLNNHSRVRFYQPPKLEVSSSEVPILSSAVSDRLMTNITFTGNLNGLAINPSKNTNFTNVNKSTTDVDYRLNVTSPFIDDSSATTSSLNSQMIGANILLYINKIQSPNSFNDIEVSQTASYFVKNIIDNNTLQIDSPYYYPDESGNQSITNITDANFSISYQFVNYNNNTSSYQTSTIGGVTYVVKQSYADVVYRNIRTFSGYIARHKIYRKSLLSNGDFSVIADEPIYANEILMDGLTQNKYYDLLGKFYSNEHIHRYWFTSSNNLSLQHTPNYAIDSMYVSSSIYTGNDYLIVKNDSVPVNRNATYVAFDMNQFLTESGSSYDSNFMALKANVQYILEISAVITKDMNQTDASLSFYFTSSSPSAPQEKNYNNQFGINLATLMADKTSSIVNLTDTYTFYTPQSDLYGTMVIVPKSCNAYIESVSFKVYGDDGFSPDVYTAKIPWPVNIGNETFQIKAELFDINNNLVYSELATTETFDPNGESISSPAYSSATSVAFSSSAHPFTPTVDTGSMYFLNAAGQHFLYIYTGQRWVSSSFS